MPKILVEGLGEVEIQGQTPNEQEQQAIIRELQSRRRFPEPQPRRPLAQAGPGTETPGLFEQLAGATRQQARPLSIGTGATVGGALGSPAGPLGMAAGAAIGGAIGSLGFRAGEDIAAGERQTTIPERLQEATQEATTELAFTGGIPALGVVFRGAKTAAGRFLGFGEQASRQAAEAAGRFGISLTNADVSSSGIVRNFSKVLGRFPFLGTPFKRAAAAKAEQFPEAADRLFLRLGPTASSLEQGVNIKRAADQSFQAFRDRVNTVYRGVRELADQKGPIIPTDIIQETAENLSQTNLRNQIFRAGEGGRLIPVKDVGESEVMELMGDLRTLQPRITGGQLDELAKRLDNAIALDRNNGLAVSQGLELKKSLERALRATGDQELNQAIRRADRLFNRGMRRFETATARKFGRVERDVFNVRRVSQAGTINDDELFKVAFNENSRRSLADLRRMIGTGNFRSAVRTHIEDVMDRAVGTAQRRAGDKFIDVGQFRRELGLDNPRSPRFQALQEALKGSGVGTSDLDDFVGALDRATSIDIPDVSAFLARRATLGGARSLGRGMVGPGGAAFGGAAGTQTSPLGVLLVTLGTRKIAKVLSQPASIKFLERYTEKPATPQGKAALIRFLRLMAEGESREERQALNETADVVRQSITQSR